jgi:dipeptidyl aminopeptidase/acylaminoacyl peptidase
VPSETATGEPTTTPPAASATASKPSFVAYVQNHELLVTDVTGGVVGGTTQYTQAGVNDGVFDLVWSPSGEYIAFVAAQGNSPAHVYVVYAVGEGTPVDLGPGEEPAWSPDSKQVAFVRNSDIYLSPIENPQPMALTHETDFAWGRPAFTTAGDALVVDGQPFNNMGASGNTEFTLGTLPLDGSGTVTPLPAFGQPVASELPYDLRFSPDGARLAFTSHLHVSACASTNQFDVVNADGSGLVELGSAKMRALLDPNAEYYAIARGFAWQRAGDGLLIAEVVVDCTNFAGTILGSVLSTVDVAGHETVLATGNYSSPSYDRGGQFIAVATSGDNGGEGQVQLLDAKGGLVATVGAGSLPVFQP